LGHCKSVNTLVHHGCTGVAVIYGPGVDLATPTVAVLMVFVGSALRDHDCVIIAIRSKRMNQLVFLWV